MTEKALVLGGGGITGIAWEIGMLAGLAEHGADLTEADLVVGTSAGSVVGVDVRSGKPLADLYQAQLAPPVGEITARMSPRLVLRYAAAVMTTTKPVRARKRVGALALATSTEPEEERRKVIESRLPVHEWPPGRLQVTAVDAESGRFAVFDAASGVSLVDAVGASCAVPGVWPPVTIGGIRYMDGGMRSAANADLAAGCQRVVVIAPIAQGFGTMPSVRTQVRKMLGQGVQVAVVTPDKAALRAFGRNMLDPARRAAAAMAGYEQSATALTVIRPVWSD